MSRTTILEGRKELDVLSQSGQLLVKRQRKAGGDRKKRRKTHADVTALLGAFIEGLKAGSPTDPNLY